MLGVCWFVVPPCLVGLTCGNVGVSHFYAGIVILDGNCVLVCNHVILRNLNERIVEEAGTLLLYIVQLVVKALTK